MGKRKNLPTATKQLWLIPSSVNELSVCSGEDDDTRCEYKVRSKELVGVRTEEGERRGKGGGRSSEKEPFEEVRARARSEGWGRRRRKRGNGKV